MIYELLDEIIDFGYPQLTSTESLKSSVYSEAVVVDPPPVTHVRSCVFLFLLFLHWTETQSRFAIG